jgi:crossover junction endodeoxyribonuclease RusA
VTTSNLFDKGATHLLSLNLPYPPSINAYYGRNKFGSVYIKKDGRNYREEVIRLLKPLIKETYQCRLRVWVEVYCPDRRRRDLDNIKKALLDAMTHAGVYTDDCLIDDLRSVRGELRKGGEVIVHLYRLED